MTHTAPSSLPAAAALFAFLDRHGPSLVRSLALSRKQLTLGMHLSIGGATGTLASVGDEMMLVTFERDARMERGDMAVADDLRVAGLVTMVSARLAWVVPLDRLPDPIQARYFR